MIDRNAMFERFENQQIEIERLRPTEQKLAIFFREMWKVFVDGGEVSGFELQEAIEKTGLAEWRPCTAEEASRFDCDIEEGDAALFLTDEGRRINHMAREAR